MSKNIYINKKISPYKKTIRVSSDKSLSIRTILLASQAVGVSKISNLLNSEDVLNTLKSVKKLGINYKTKKNCLPVEIEGTKFLRPIEYTENIGSAQCKSTIMFAALNTPGITKINAKKSRNHTEL